MLAVIGGSWSCVGAAEVVTHVLLSVAVPFLGNVTLNCFQWLLLELFSTRAFLLDEGPKTWHSSCTYEVKMRKWMKTVASKVSKGVFLFYPC